MAPSCFWYSNSCVISTCTFFIEPSCHWNCAIAFCKGKRKKFNLHNIKHQRIVQFLLLHETIICFCTFSHLWHNDIPQVRFLVSWKKWTQTGPVKLKIKCSALYLMYLWLDGFSDYRYEFFFVWVGIRSQHLIQIQIAGCGDRKCQSSLKCI